MAGLTEYEFIKVMHCKSTKQIWDKLKNVYEGDTKVQRLKIQVYRSEDDSLKMQEEEDMTNFFQKVDEVVNTIKGLMKDVNEQEVVQKVLRYLPIRFNRKVSIIEENENLGKLTMDALRGILIAKTRMGQEMPLKRETTFKVSKGSKNHEHVSNENHSDLLDEEEANFIRKLKKGSGKYKGKLPFKIL